MDSYDLINNINKLYKPKISDEQTPFYHEYLKTYSDSQRRELWSSIVISHVKTTPPTIGELNKYAVNILNGYQERPTAEKKPSDEEYLNSYLGRIGLKQGWAHSYIVHCMDKGAPEQTDDWILFFQKGQEAAKRAYESLPKEGNVFDKALAKLYVSMREKNAMLKKNYAWIMNEAEPIQVEYWYN